MRCSDALTGSGYIQASLKYLQVAQHYLAIYSSGSGVVISFGRGANTVFPDSINSPRPEHITLVILISLLLFPVNSYTAYLNSGMEIAEWLGGLEDWMKVEGTTGRIFHKTDDRI